MLPLAACAALLIGVPAPATTSATAPPAAVPALSGEPGAGREGTTQSEAAEKREDARLEEAAIARFKAGERVSLSNLTTVLGAPVVEPSLAQERADSFSESVKALEGYLETLKQRSPPTPTTQETERKLNVARFRAQAWKRLAKLFASMPPAAQQSFRSLPAPREPLWEQVNALRVLRKALSDWNANLQDIQNVLDSGRLVGFMSQQQALSEDLGDLRLAARAHSANLGDAVGDLGALAETQHRDGEVLYEAILRATITEAEKSLFDSMYLDALAELRRARRLAGSGYLRLDTIKRLQNRIQGGTPAHKLVSVDDAEAALVAAREALHNLDTSLAALGNQPLQWVLAFRREQVTALEPLASAATRRQANQLTRELLEDLQVEALDAWRNIVSGYNDARTELARTPWPHLARQGLLAVLVLLLVGLIVTKKLNPIARITHWVAKRDRFRGRVGTVVRVGNFFHTVFPAVAVVCTFWVGTSIVLGDRTEAEILDVVVKWYGLYVIGDRILLGLVNPTWGRSAFIVAQPNTVSLLDKTYSRLGFFFVLVLMVEDAASRFLGVSRLRVLIDLFMLVWLAGWALWAATAWRHTLAEAWNIEKPNKAAAWMAASRFGAILSPVALMVVIYLFIWKAGRTVLARGGILSYFRARSLRRKAREEPAPASAAEALPEDYVDEFPLRPILGDSDTLVLPREEINAEVLGQLQQWQQTRRSSSIVLVGEKGIGKTTLMVQLRSRVEDLECLEHTWVNKSVTEADVVRELAPTFGADPRGSCNALIEAACSRERVVFLDEAHNVFLRIIDGYQGFDALVKIVNATSDKVFWVLSFNAFSWKFINESKGRTHYFRRLLWLPRWERSDIQSLIEQRNRRSGFQVTFDPVLLGTQREGRPGFALVESAEGFFRLLWETSRGIPRVALYFWLQSLQAQGERTLLAQLFKEPDLSDVPGLTDEIVFVLAAICQHESLCVSDVDTVLRMGTTNARFALQFLGEHGLVEPKRSDPNSMGLAPRYYSQVLRFLRSRHLLFEGR